MITVKMDEDYLVDLLVERVNFWTDDEDIIHLYESMYQSYVDGGCFDGIEINIMQIVDNDYINYCDVLCEGDDNYNEVKELYEVQGLGDCSCDGVGYSYIEAEKDGMFLVRW